MHYETFYVATLQQSLRFNQCGYGGKNQLDGKELTSLYYIQQMIYRQCWLTLCVAMLPRLRRFNQGGAGEISWTGKNGRTHITYDI